MRKNTVKIYYNYYFDGVGEKLARSQAHAAKMAQTYAQKLGHSVSYSFCKKIVIKNGRVIYGY